MTKELLHTRRWSRFLAVVLFSVLLTACGSEGTDESSTATTAPSDAQPTVIAEEQTPASSPDATAASSVPANTDMSTLGSEAPPVAGTPEDGDAVASTPGTGNLVLATPATSPDAVSASPVAIEGTAAPIAGEIPDGSFPANADLGDGTTGALVPATPEPGAGGATAIASPASPAASASPIAARSVSSCEVADVPPFTGESTTYRLVEDLNFRTGPGPDCELAADDPIGAFQVVEVTGGPVVREDDGTEWVRVEVLDTEGWVVFEFLEPIGE